MPLTKPESKLLAKAQALNGATVLDDEPMWAVAASLVSKGLVQVIAEFPRVGRTVSAQMTIKA